MRMNLTCTKQEEQEQRNFINGTAKEEVRNFEKELGIKFTEFKTSALSIEENNTLLWAKQIFKTKPNHEVDAELKTKIKTVFHHLTKDELIEKLLIICCKTKTNQ
jgi:ATP-dependent RNA helicase DeaD